MPLVKKIIKSGGSAALVIDKTLLQILDLKIGDLVSVQVDDVLGRLIITKPLGVNLIDVVDGELMKED